MQVTATVTNKIEAFTKESFKDDYYRTPHGARRVKPREIEFLSHVLDHDIESCDDGVISCGYDAGTDGSLLYVACSGNWVFLHPNGKTVSAGGQRQGIPWGMIGVESIRNWQYKKTQTPHLHPMKGNTDEGHQKYVKQKLAEAGLRWSDNEWVQNTLLQFAQKKVSVRGMSGYKLERKLSWAGVSEHDRKVIAQHVMK